MAQRLSDIQPGEVSLVKRGANRKRFLLAKADDLDEVVAEILAAPAAHESALLDAVRKTGGDESVEKAAAAFARAGAALADAYGQLPGEVVKAMSRAMRDDMLDEDAGDDGDGDEPDDDDTVEMAKAYETLLKRDFTAEQRKKLAETGAAMSNGSYPIETKGDLENAVHAIGRGNAPHADIRAHIIRRARALGATDLLPDDWNVTKEDEVTETAQAVPVKKEDGTWDLSAVPEEQRPAFEAVIKAHDDEVTELRKQAETEASKADEAIRIAKEERDARETREYIAKSEGFTHLAKDDTEFGGLLRDIAKAERDETLPEGTLEKLEAVLKAANEAVEKGALFAEMGRTGHGSTSADSKLDAVAKELRDADPTLTEAKAIAKALEMHPDLYDEYRKEN